MKHMIGITTFKKNTVLDCILESLFSQGYSSGNPVVIADDNPGEALEVFKKHSFVEAYLTGNRHGIWANKNRIIKYFFQENDADALLLLDNDIQFLRPGFLKELENGYFDDDQQHITGYVIDADGGDGLEKAFHHDAESDGSLKWHPGCHGCLLWFTRDNLKKVGYMRKQKYFYGGEHSELSNRSLVVQGYAPGNFPVAKRSPRFFRDSPVNFHAYDVDLERVYKENLSVTDAQYVKTAQGIELKNFDHGLDREIIVLPQSDWTRESIEAHLNTSNIQSKKSKSRKDRKKIKH